jgi:hypothetical protein
MIVCMHENATCPIFWVDILKVSTYSVDCRRCTVATEVINASVLRKQSLLLQLEFLFVGFSTKSSSPACMLNELLVQLHFSALIMYVEEYKSWISSFCHFLQPSVTSFPQATYIFWIILLVCWHSVGFLYLSVDGIENQETAVCQLRTNCALSVNILTSVRWNFMGWR